MQASCSGRHRGSDSMRSTHGGARRASRYIEEVFSRGIPTVSLISPFAF